MKKLFVLIFLAAITSSFVPRTITWVAIGDSITYLNDHPDETNNRITKGYMTRVTEKLPDFHFTNQGHNGWNSADIAKDIDKLGLVNADVYSVFLGTNDWWAGHPVGVWKDYLDNTGIKTVYGSFRIIINKLRGLNKHARIILITPMQRADFVYLGNMKNNAWGSYKEKAGQKLSQIVDAISAIGYYEDFDVVDLYNASSMKLENLVKFKRLKDPTTGVYKNYKYPDFINIPFNPEKDEYPYPPEAIGMTYDGLHPSDEGFQVIADMLVKVMKDLK